MLRLSGLLFILCSISLNVAPTAAAKEYPVGTKLRDIVQIDFNSGSRAIPLPPGQWEVALSKKWTVSNNNLSDISFYGSYLVRIEGKKVTGALYYNTPADLPDFGWVGTGICENSKLRLRSWILEGTGSKGDPALEDCLGFSWLRGFNVRSKNVQKVFNYLSQKGVTRETIPNGWFRLMRNYSSDENLIRIRLYLSTEAAGFPREPKFSYSDSPWMPNNIATHPKKKKFVDQAKGWARSWNDLITKGINNQLTLGAVQSHSTITGMYHKTSRATLPTQKGSGSDDKGDVTAKLKKLKAMFEAELITQDEYEAKKSEILSSM
ncbi:MAG: hypothetical protein CMM44_01145 [Rhodospirillaceae bacterium]|nr:hypothetical protein [Rhodospirillaceae bacterium]